MTIGRDPEATDTDASRPRGPSGLALALGATLGLVAAVVVIMIQRPSDRAVPVDGPVPRPADASWAPGARPAPDFILVNQDGDAVALSSMRGRTVLLTFLNSHCEHICPIVGPMLGDVQRRLPAAERPLIVAVSVNPEDSAASVRAAARRWGWQRDGWQWLMGERERLARVWDAYAIGVSFAPDDVQHTGALYVIDRMGDERAGFAAPFDPQRVAELVRSLHDDV